MQLSDYAQALGAAQRLVPSYAGQQRDAADLQSVQLQNQQAQMQIAAQRQQDADGQAFHADVTALGAKPTADQYRNIALRHPAFFKPISDIADTLDAQHKQTTIGHMAQISSAIVANRPDLAAAQVQRHIDADTAAGNKPDEEDVALVKMLNSGDPAQVKAAGVLVHGTLSALDPKVAGAVGPDNENHYTSTGDGAVYDQRTGNVVRQAPVKTEYKSIGPGETLVEVGGNAGGGGQASGGGAAGGSGQPRNVRNKNPGNIIDSPFAKSQPGYVGSDGRFAIFDSEDSGQKAQGALLGSYIDRGFNTVGKIINRWAPPSENNTGAYVASVARELGVNPSDTLSKASVPRLMAAIARVEGGPGSSSSGVAGGIASGGARVVAQGAPKAGAQRMTPDQVRAEGLDPKIAYYRDANGVPQAVSGQSRPTRQALQLTEGQAKATGLLGTMVAAVSSLNTVRGYKPSAVALALNDLSNKNPIKDNLSQADRRVLNAQLAFANSILRLESGAAIGKDEAAAKAQTLFPMPGDGPEVQADKRAQREAALRSMRVGAGPGSESVAQGKPAGGGISPGKVVTVSTPAQAASLKPGTLYRAPDGKVRRR